MKLLVVRHGKAWDRDAFKKVCAPRDDLRPLTKKGAGELGRLVKKLRRKKERLASVYSSEYVRSLETAQIICSSFPKANWKIDPRLNADRPVSDVIAFVNSLKKSRKKELTAIVGHNPTISQLAKELLSDKKKIELKKGEMMCLSLDSQEKKVLWRIRP